MFDKLQAVRQRFEEIGIRLQSPDVAADNAQYRSLMKEYHRLEPVAECYTRYEAAKSAYDQADELLGESGLDPELRELAQEEYVSQKEALRKLESELRELLLPRDGNDDRSVIVEIRGGAGGQ